MQHQHQSSFTLSNDSLVYINKILKAKGVKNEYKTVQQNNGDAGQFETLERLGGC